MRTSNNQFPISSRLFLNLSVFSFPASRQSSFFPGTKKIANTVSEKDHHSATTDPKTSEKKKEKTKIIFSSLLALLVWLALGRSVIQNYFFFLQQSCFRYCFWLCSGIGGNTQLSSSFEITFSKLHARKIENDFFFRLRSERGSDYIVSFADGCFEIFFFRFTNNGSVLKATFPFLPGQIRE